MGEVVGVLAGSSAIMTFGVGKGMGAGTGAGALLGVDFGDDLGGGGGAGSETSAGTTENLSIWPSGAAEAVKDSFSFSGSSFVVVCW